MVVFASGTLGLTLGWIVLCYFGAKHFQLHTSLGTYGKLGTRFSLSFLNQIWAAKQQTSCKVMNKICEWALLLGEQRLCSGDSTCLLATAWPRLHCGLVPWVGWFSYRYWFLPCTKSFSPGTLVFLPPQNPTSPNSNSTRIEDLPENQAIADVASSLNIIILLVPLLVSDHHNLFMAFFCISRVAHMPISHLCYF